MTGVITPAPPPVTRAGGAPATGRAIAALAGAAGLELHLGDPRDPANPLGFTPILAADERDEMFAVGETALDGYGLNAHFVPVALGGRLAGVDELIRVMRSVFRRDPALGLGYGASSFIASVNVWAGGSAAQHARLTRLLLDNRKVASVYHELAHGNDFARVEFRADADPADPGRLRLRGRKEIVTNVQRADALVIFSRTADLPGGRSHSQLFVEKADVEPGRMTYLPRFPSAGMRGVQLGGIEFHDAGVPADVVLGGEPGHAMEIALRSFQLTRTALPAMVAGILDTGLRTTVQAVHDRSLYGRPVAAMPHTRAVLADAFLDALIADCVATVAARALHVLPEETCIAASTAKYFVAGRATGVMYRLSQLLGARFYVRDGVTGIFQKMLRDLAPAGFGHAARVACLATVLPQLPRVARRSWGGPADVPPELFDLAATLPVLDYARLRVAAPADHLTGALLGAAVSLPADVDPRLAGLAARLVAEVTALRAAALAIPPRALAVGADADALEVPARYATLFAAGACLNVWLANRRGADPFLADPTWVVAALARLVGELDGAWPPPTEPSLGDAIYTEVVARHRADELFDLSRLHLPG